jgi:hypothetical protein
MLASDNLFGLPPAASPYVQLPGDPPALRTELRQQQAEYEMGPLPPVSEEPP